MKNRSGLVLSLVSLLTLCLNLVVVAKDVTLEVWYQNTKDKQMYRTLADKFEVQNPGIHINLSDVPGDIDGYEEKLRLAIMGGSPPNVAILNQTQVLPLAQGGLLLPLNPWLSPSVGKYIIPWAWQEITYQGKQWAMPLFTDVRGLWWNQRLFQEVGLKSDQGPKTLTELEQFARKLTRSNGDGKITQLGFAPWVGNWAAPGWMWAFGGDIFDPNTGKPNIISERNMAAFTWITEWGKAYPPDTWSSQVAKGAQRFAVEAGAMEANTNNFLVSVQERNPNISVGTGLVPHTQEGANGSWAGGPGLIIPKGAADTDIAAKFILYMTTAESQVVVYQQRGYLPTNMEALKKVYTLAPPHERPFLDQLPSAHARTPLWRDVMVELRLDELVAGELSVLQFARQVQTALETALSRTLGK